jgi:uncharacterized RDD family membrane protein YckC
VLIDWFAASGVAYLFVGSAAVQGAGPQILLPLVIFVLEMALFTSLLGGSFGQLLTRLRVVRLDGARLGPVPSLVRSAMIAMVIPPLVFRPDGRGLHDMVAGSRVVVFRPA